MKVVQKHVDAALIPNPSITGIQTGTVFTFRYDGDKAETYYYLRTSTGAVCLVRNQYFSDANFGFQTLPNYKEYPNARVVLK